MEKLSEMQLEKAKYIEKGRERLRELAVPVRLAHTIDFTHLRGVRWCDLQIHSSVANEMFLVLLCVCVCGCWLPVAAA